MSDEGREPRRLRLGLLIALVTTLILLCCGGGAASYFLDGLNGVNNSAYGAACGRQGLVVDPDEADEPMYGMPVTRVPSPNGRWQYTLYNAPHAFVHALDTVARDARCVDLDSLTGRTDLPDLRLSLGSGELSVRDREGKALAVVDTATFEPTAPASGGRRWTGVVVAGILLAGILLAFNVLPVRSRRAWAARLPRMRPR